MLDAGGTNNSEIGRDLITGSAPITTVVTTRKKAAEAVTSLRLDEGVPSAVTNDDAYIRFNWNPRRHEPSRSHGRRRTNGGRTRPPSPRSPVPTGRQSVTPDAGDGAQRWERIYNTMTSKRIDTPNSSAAIAAPNDTVVLLPG